MLDHSSHESFWAKWRNNIDAKIPNFISLVGRFGVYGTIAASVAILAQVVPMDPELARYSTFLLALGGNFVSNWVERLRSAPDTATQEKLLEQLAIELEARHREPEISNLFRQLGYELPIVKSKITITSIEENAQVSVAGRDIRGGSLDDDANIESEIEISQVKSSKVEAAGRDLDTNQPSKS